MGKPTKRPRLAAKAAAAATKSKPETSATLPKPSRSISNQRTKDGKRQARHNAFLKSPAPSSPPVCTFPDALEIQDQTTPKRIRKKRPNKRANVNLLSLGDSLEEIMAEDKKARSRKMEISSRPKAAEVKAEIQRFKAVMQHPQFKENPLKAIRQHVENVWERKEGMSV